MLKDFRDEGFKGNDQLQRGNFILKHFKIRIEDNIR